MALDRNKSQEAKLKKTKDQDLFINLPDIASSLNKILIKMYCLYRVLVCTVAGPFRE